MIEQVKNKIKEAIKNNYSIEEVILQDAKKDTADLAIPLFGYAKELNLKMPEIFEQLKTIIEKLPEVAEVTFLNGFLNINLEREVLTKNLLIEIFNLKNEYGTKKSNNETVVMDYSSPNIAKNFSVGHLRSTMIGNSLKLIYQKNGYKVVGINYLGDWGTQFGKMIVAYKKWGSKEEVLKNPINELQRLYVLFHEKAKDDETLEDEARHAFLMLEQGNEEMLELWRWFKDESLKEFTVMYDLLGVSFDSYAGESFYNDKMDAVVKELEDKNLVKLSDGALIVDLDETMPPALIKRSDGGTLYMTRDIAALLYRYHTYHFSKIIYIVGNEQKLHFQQLSKVAQKMGYDFDITHVNFGLVLLDGKKLSTRSGAFAKLSDVMTQAISDAKNAITEKNPSLENKDEVAHAVGVGAVIFNDLKNERHLDMEFNLANMLKFEGQTGPYLQYSGVRIHSILKNQEINTAEIDSSVYNQDHYFELLKLVAQFPLTIERAMQNNAPNVISRYLLSLCQGFNQFYAKQRVIVPEEGIKQANLLLVNAVLTIIEEGLRLLGMKALKEM
ncbi:Arginyl-tRNA synthetase [Alteracholeplasma palmae J233]|uniref:Arginine--tRNA ligase n=1 Tax=Alteracholeplasma palmae (strain ATCC 49389 / J233) TaxID=1318466 RepID=U4KLF1_ALTPJ|nr:arginine--tRNA ligase [Alteracholeplasma palmae]CCV64643.1 Arginyl-tRNA synthetase [Alteracholeplasma palmae J233]